MGGWVGGWVGGWNLGGWVGGIWGGGGGGEGKEEGLTCPREAFRKVTERVHVQAVPSLLYCVGRGKERRGGWVGRMDGKERSGVGGWVRGVGKEKTDVPAPSP